MESLRAPNVLTAFLSLISVRGRNGSALAISKEIIRHKVEPGKICFFSFSCQVVIKICEDANKLSVDESTCAECDARQIVVEYRPVNSISFSFVLLLLFICFVLIAGKKQIDQWADKSDGLHLLFHWTFRFGRKALRFSRKKQSEKRAWARSRSRTRSCKTKR